MSYLHDQRPLSNKRLSGMKKKILELLLQSERLSELKGLQLGLGTSLRTRISELRKLGYDIKDEFVKSSTGAIYKEYFLEVGGVNG